MTVPADLCPRKQFFIFPEATTLGVKASVPWEHSATLGVGIVMSVAGDSDARTWLGVGGISGCQGPRNRLLAIQDPSLLGIALFHYEQAPSLALHQLCG